MKAIRIHQTGGPEVLRYEEVPSPTPGPGQVLVNLQAIGVNYAEINARSGGGAAATLPMTPGGEGAGVVAALGEGVTEVKVGDVVAYNGVPGSYAQQAVVPAARLVRVPAGLSSELAAAVLLQGMTAHYLSHDTYPLKPGDKALVHAGAGGVGLLLVQMAKRLGAEVFATVSTDAKAALAREAGADHVINYEAQDFAEEIKRLTNGQGVQVVYDAVGKTTFDKSLASLAPRGMLALYGQASGPVPSMDPAILGRGSLFLTRPGLPAYTATRQELLQRSGEVFSWVMEGKLKVHIYGKYPLEQAPEAHRALQGRETTGKLLLIP